MTLGFLEVQAGTGATTAHILQALTSAYGQRFYSTYAYRDVSFGLFTAAKQRSANNAAMEYTILHVSLDQGFKLGSYDLIVPLI
ncbi:fatty acid synthase S-acetyltransferase [Metarhizium acridum CQMa 102]|uniref:Fatty acid synthase S-acetyltransferase n=1 Tax=Metarhizium acridum (strain CQMa 102) TaxID=655827 RepID=E9EE01_METAQ|nr:fatty acid synthase S-acetyltransferase [Metarhizium acridum CQMa 102]EFY85840.1 fatty acid synthase S-acetyltransferase [Metarhizium acridum CQMa 102]